jgi:hypothetical protein
MGGNEKLPSNLEIYQKLVAKRSKQGGKKRDRKSEKSMQINCQRYKQKQHN